MTLAGDPLKLKNAGAAQRSEAEDQECAEFQALMSTRIGNGEDLLLYPHMQTCERCRALLNDLETIAFVARQLIPAEEDPGDDLWVRIESQLAIERGDA